MYPEPSRADISLHTTFMHYRWRQCETNERLRRAQEHVESVKALLKHAEEDAAKARAERVMLTNEMCVDAKPVWMVTLRNEYGDEEVAYEREADARALWASMVARAGPLGEAGLKTKGFIPPKLRVVLDTKCEDHNSNSMRPAEMLELATAVHALRVTAQKAEYWGLFRTAEAAHAAANAVREKGARVEHRGIMLLCDHTIDEIEQFRDGDVDTQQFLVDCVSE